MLKENYLTGSLVLGRSPSPRRTVGRKWVQGYALVVEVNGFEPMASCVQGRRSPN